MSITRAIEPDKELVPANDPYSLPSKPQVLEVIPDMASSWLSYRGTHPMLRPLSKSVAGGYQRLMESGRWREATPEGLIFDTEGYGISFQHRMKALANCSPDTLTAKYGRPWLKFWVFPNESRDIAPFLDQGLRRTAAHIIRVPYAKDMGTGARHLAAVADGDRWGMPRYNRVLVPEIVETFGQWPELAWYPSEVWAVWRATGVPAGAHLAVIAQAARTEHRDRIPAWLEGLRTGFNLSEGDPRAHLRNRFRNGFNPLGKVNKRDNAYAVITKAWNAYASGESLTVLRQAVSEPLPMVIGYGIAEGAQAA